MGSTTPLPPTLSAGEERELLALARFALERYVQAGELLDEPPDRWANNPRLLIPQGVFVSLHHRARLRGCVGISEPSKPLAHAVMENTVSAAIRDLRFPPVERGELPEILIEISVMGPLSELVPSSVVTGTHGLMIELRGRRGLLLPQVAREQRWDRETLLRQLCLKAGLAENAWTAPGARLLGFTAQVFAEARA
jgi:AmmeMemoRadiSam system protein A